MNDQNTPFSSLQTVESVRDRVTKDLRSAFERLNAAFADLSNRVGPEISRLEAANADLTAVVRQAYRSRPAGTARANAGLTAVVRPANFYHLGRLNDGVRQSEERRPVKPGTRTAARSRQVFVARRSTPGRALCHESPSFSSLKPAPLNMVRPMKRREQQLIEGRPPEQGSAASEVVGDAAPMTTKDRKAFEGYERIIAAAGAKTRENPAHESRWQGARVCSLVAVVRPQ